MPWETAQGPALSRFTDAAQATAAETRADTMGAAAMVIINASAAERISQ